MSVCECVFCRCVTVFSHCRIHLFSSLAANLFNKLTRYSLLVIVGSRYRAFSLPGQLAPWSDSASRMLANSLRGQIAPWSFHSLSLSFPDHFSPGTFTTWPFRSRWSKSQFISHIDVMEVPFRSRKQSSREQEGHGANGPGSESSREQIGQGGLGAKRQWIVGSLSFAKTRV